MHKVIIEWTEKVIREDYYGYLKNECVLKDETAKKKADSMPIEKIIKSPSYLKSFQAYEMIHVCDEPFSVEVRVKGKK